MIRRHPHARGMGMASHRSRERLVKTLMAEGIRESRVLAAVGKVPRHEFIDEALASRAYDNTALPIGLKQTISQPYVVARMTELLLEGGPLRSVLEIGTGCGYQTAILAEVSDWVYTIERIEALFIQARDRLIDMGYGRTRFRHGDGYLGWPEYRPFDAIIVTAATPSIPKALLGQLGEGGRLVIPVGAPGMQRLKLITRTRDAFGERNFDAVSFVPMLAGKS